ncbi:MAG: Hydrogenase maturation factor HypA [uncultured Thiotrichaceae bacterium]|uniref:Hydrogenase maturation factor HypA n=1 Tax=uncultured Thiotrichaceae bacterium TaxID=298394 RepID=A0A6S6UHI6_9GAMM|nr:MAG: Hydrogenase maturation factor HypA [uncultured Thiotrichaceae bacterium]
MHELAICQALIGQVEQITLDNNAEKVTRIVVKIGPLSGAEAPLIERAYPMAAAGTIAENSLLVLETMPIRVRCKSCLAETEASANRLLCGECGDFHTELISGDEMLLAAIEFDKAN